MWRKFLSLNVSHTLLATRYGKRFSKCSLQCRDTTTYRKLTAFASANCIVSIYRTDKEHAYMHALFDDCFIGHDLADGITRVECSTGVDLNLILLNLRLFLQIEQQLIVFFLRVVCSVATDRITGLFPQEHSHTALLLRTSFTVSSLITIPTLISIGGVRIILSLTRTLWKNRNSYTIL